MLIPLGDDQGPPKARAWLTLGLIVSNLAIFGWLVHQGGDVLEDAIGSYGARPHLLLVALSHFWQTALSSMFLHASWEHVLGNMLFLWIFGPTVEQALGEVRYIGFFLFCGLAALAVHTACTPRSVIPMVGASGAIAGVMGGFLRLFPTHRIRTLYWFVLLLGRVRIPAWLYLGVWLGFQALALHSSHVSHGGVAVAAHLGGFAAGFTLAPFALGAPPSKSPDKSMGSRSKERT